MEEKRRDGWREEKDGGKRMMERKDGWREENDGGSYDKS